MQRLLKVVLALILLVLLLVLAGVRVYTHVMIARDRQMVREAIAAQQWDVAARGLIQLKQHAAEYDQFAEVPGTYPQVRQAMVAQRAVAWQSGNVARETTLQHSQPVDHHSPGTIFQPERLQAMVDGSRLTGWLQRNGSGPEVLSAAFSMDGHWLAAGSADGSIKLWHSEDGRVKYTLHGHDNWVGSVAFSPDGKLLASGSSDRTIKLWRVQDGRLLQTLRGHDDRVRSVTFSPDGTLLASGGTDDTIRLWNVADGTLQRTLMGHQGTVRSVAFSPDGKVLASGSADMLVKLWRVQDGILLRDLPAVHEVRDVAFSPDGKTLAVGIANDSS
jgi:tricorn protease-like protein